MLNVSCGSSALQVVGKGVLGSVGIVMSINEQEGIATVKFPSCEYRKACKASDILTVPISRLCTPRSEVYVSASYTTQPLFLWKISASISLVSPFHSLPTPNRLSLSISSQSQKRWYKQCSPCFSHRRAVSPFTLLYQLQEMAPVQ